MGTLKIWVEEPVDYDSKNAGDIRRRSCMKELSGVVPLLITAHRSGSRHMCRMDKYGFPRTSAKQAKRVKGFQTGDIVRAVVTCGEKKGTYVGRVAVRATGSFNITTKHGTIQGINSRYCQAVHRMDGYSYQKGGQEPQCPSPE